MKKNKLIKITSAILATAIVGTTFFAYFRVPAAASLSLNNIENIKALKQNGNDAFRIVEIAPSSNYGTMGYYVPGQEPSVVSNWLETVSKMDNAAERTAYANDYILTLLENNGLISYGEDAAPLKKNGEYIEYYPWTEEFYSNNYDETTTELQIGGTESWPVTGSAVQYTEDDEAHNVSKKGYDYNMDYNYSLAEITNLFDFNQWYSGSLAAQNNILQMTDSNSSFEIDEGNASVTIKMTGNNPLNISWIKGTGFGNEDSLFKAKLTIGQSYILSYRTDLNPASKSESEYYNLESRLDLYGYTTQSLFSLVPVDYTENENGYHFYTFTATTPYVAFTFGAKGIGDVKFSDIQLYKEVDADYVQNITKFTYGNAPTAYSDNLFNIASWYANKQSQALSNQTQGDLVTYDPNERTVTITSDNVGGDDVYTLYDPKDSYFMNAEPGATYEVTYDVSKEGPGNPQFHIFPYKSGLAGWSGVTSSTSGSSSFDCSYSTGSIKLTFTVNDDTHFLKLRFGVTQGGTTATFSSIRVRKLLDKKSYYYNITKTGEYYYRSASDYVYPPSGSSLYKINSEGHYEYLGIYYYDDSGIRITSRDEDGNFMTYYTVDITPGTYPDDSFNEQTHPYYAEGDSFSSVIDYNDAGLPYKTKPGYFIRGDGILNFAGLSKGEFKINFQGTESLTVKSNRIFYKGGFSNNNWFKYKVLDADDKDTNGNDVYTFPISVMVLDPSNEAISSYIEHADLVVISTGLDLFADSVPYSSDFPDNTVSEIIKQKVNNKEAVIVDKSLKSVLSDTVSPNLKSLVNDLLSGVESGGVKGSIYSFSASDISQTNAMVKTLANKNFCTDAGKISAAENEGNPYFPVYHEIQQEDDLRERQGVSALVNRDVNEATCIRYILNYANQRAYNVADKIKILDIEPSTSTPSLTLEKINKMMPKKSRQNQITGEVEYYDYYTENDVEIIGMSVAEFVAKNEDFSEIYDAVYIGASTDNMPRILKKNDTFNYVYKNDQGQEVTGTGTIGSDGKADPTYRDLMNQRKVPSLVAGDPVYNDPHMNGMYYTNVGDMVVTANKTAVGGVKDLANPPELGGLLKEDYINIGDWIIDTAADAWASMTSWLSWTGLVDEEKAREQARETVSGWGVVQETQKIYIPLGGHATMRASGNDLNESAMQRLQDFAESGRPVIIADKLTSLGMNETFTAEATAINLTKDTSQSGLVYKNTFTATISNSSGNELPDDFNVTYHWYRIDPDGTTRDLNDTRYGNGNANDKNYSGEFKSTGLVDTGRKQKMKKKNWLGQWIEYEVPIYEITTTGLGKYYCTITFTYHGISRSINTNTVEITKKAPDDFIARYYCEYQQHKVLGVWYDDGDQYFWTKFYDHDGNDVTSTINTKYSVVYTWYDGDSQKQQGSSNQFHRDLTECKVSFTFYVDGQGIIFNSVKAGGQPTPRLFSRHKGNYTGESDYPYRDLYSIHRKRKDWEYLENHSPEFQYCITEINQTPIFTEPETTTIKSDSEANASNIDNCSYMWRFIVNEYYDHLSVFNESDAKDSTKNENGGETGTSLLSKALLISKPSLEFQTGSLNEYPNELTSKTLNLKFWIYDETNPVASPTYKAELYIDTNGDGKFSESEKELYKMTDLAVSERNKPASERKLHTYSKTFNSTYKGIIPWKLLLTEEHPYEGKTAGHTSYTGYSYIKPAANDPITIDAVMMLPGSWNPAEWTDYNSAYLEVNSLVGKTLNFLGEGKKIKTVNGRVPYWSENEYIGCVFASPVFSNLDNLERMTQEDFAAEGLTLTTWDGIGGVDNGDGYYHLGFKVNGNDIKIKITCVNIHQMNAYYGLQTGEDFSGTTWTHTSEDTTCPNKGKTLKGMYCTKCGLERTDDYLSRFNMLIMGFGDSWGKLAGTLLDVAGNDVMFKEGLSVNTALAIRNYVKSGKATLFCHDTTNNTVDFVDLYLDKLKSIGLDIWNFIMKGWNYIADAIGINAHADTTEAKLQNTKILEGYWDNMILRDYLGLDRYGITNAITTRAESIANKEVQSEQPFANNEGDPYNNVALGRAHMYNYIYNGFVTPGDDGQSEKFVERNLTVDKMLSTDHSIAWVPGTADVWKRSGENAGHSADGVYEVTTSKDEFTGETIRTVTQNDGVMVYADQPKLDSAGNIRADYDRYAQGYTNYTIAQYADPFNTTQYFPTASLDRFSVLNADGKTYNRDALTSDAKYQALFKTNKITQVNEGKITTYPYDINIGDLHTEAGMNSTYTIAETHNQVYQCNMNGDDITVWFALAGGDFWNQNSDGTYSGIRNDAANAYYIFSRKNVTYTGAGHTNKFTEIEAKLFINTLVAAYRDTYTAPSVSYRDKLDTKLSKYLLMSPDVDVNGNEYLLPEDDVYLIVNDTNTGSGKKVAVEFYYFDSNGNAVPITDITLKYGNQTENMQQVHTQKLLHFEVPESVKNLFYNDERLTSIKVYCKPTTTIPAQDSSSTTKPTVVPGEATAIEIGKLDLSKLS